LREFDEAQISELFLKATELEIGGITQPLGEGFVPFQDVARPVVTTLYGVNLNTPLCNTIESSDE